MGQGHQKTSNYILLKITPSISISPGIIPLDLKKTSFLARTTLGGRFQILRFKKKIDLRDYYNKTSLFLKTFKINH